MTGSGVEKSQVTCLKCPQALGIDECGVEVETYNFMKEKAAEIAKYKASD